MKKSILLKLISTMIMVSMVTGCGGTTNPPAPEETLLDAANHIMQLLKDKDMSGLSSYIDEEKGLRLTPYSYVDIANDIVIGKDEISSMLTDPTMYIFGAYDGNGVAIDLTISEYYDEFIYDQDFIAAPVITENAIVGTGNNINNILDVYIDASYVEYHFPEIDPQYEGLDWESLILVLGQTDDGYKLVGIIHACWTI